MRNYKITGRQSTDGSGGSWKRFEQGFEAVDDGEARKQAQSYIDKKFPGAKTTRLRLIQFERVRFP